MASGISVRSALERKEYDGIPEKHEGTHEINQLIMDFYSHSNMSK